MLNTGLIVIGKTLSKISKILNLGSGSTWPGHIALIVNKNFIKDILSTQKTKDQGLKTILIAGTNGKTTTSKLIKTILKQNGQKVFQNESGANLLNGIASSLIINLSLITQLNYDYAIFETDESSLPLVLKELTPNYIILLNLFRDQLDRYGEVNTIAEKWKESLDVIARRDDEAISRPDRDCHAPSVARNDNKTTLILNADDPQIAYLGTSLCHSDLSNCHPECSEGSNPRIFYFGLNDKKIGKSKSEHAADSIYCPKCGTKLNYDAVYFSHLGDWECKNCKLKRPKLDLSNSPIYPLVGLYNKYNTNAAVLFAKINNVNDETIKQSLKNFTPAFGRQEIIEINGKKVQIFLSKNPTSFNQSLKTVIELGAKNLLIALNDQIPDGRDVSWIWDIDFEEYLHDKMNIVVSGDRVFDMGLRIKYSSETQKSKIKTQNQNLKFKTYVNLEKAIGETLKQLSLNETLYILPTYSAMLEVRKILTGKKIL